MRLLHRGRMVEDARPRTGAFVLCAWIEASDGSLRIRITSTLDVLSDQTETDTARSVEEACAKLEAWLDDFVGS